MLKFPPVTAYRDCFHGGPAAAKAPPPRRFPRPAAAKAPQQPRPRRRQSPAAAMAPPPPWPYRRQCPPWPRRRQGPAAASSGRAMLPLHHDIPNMHISH